MCVTSKATLLLVSAFAAWAAPDVVLAQPPAHAPAHGWRQKHDPSYAGYKGKQWERDFDIASGSCNRQEIATVDRRRRRRRDRQSRRGRARTVATIVGAIAGAVIGNRIGRELDEADRGCFGHALEIGAARPTRHLDKRRHRPALRAVPGADRPRGGTTCREYTLVTVDAAAANARRTPGRRLPIRRPESGKSRSRRRPSSSHPAGRPSTTAPPGYTRHATRRQRVEVLR